MGEPKNRFQRVTDIIRRVIIFIPLVFASLLAYPLSLVCCTQITRDVRVNNGQLPMIQGSGVLAVRKQDLNSSRIAGVELRTTGKVFINRGNESSLTLTTDDNLIDQFEFRSEGNKLVLATKVGSFDFRHEPTCTLTLPENLSALSIAGSGNIILDELTADKFSCKIRGSGKVDVFEGMVNHQKIVISGSGKYIAHHVSVANSYVDIRGSGSVEIQADETLNVNIGGSGECVYTGNPQINRHVFGVRWN